jgi:Tol biopolymer transport system component
MVPGSFAPDGSNLAVTRQIIGREAEVALQPVSGGGARRVSAPATEPVFSPDGSQIAFVRPSFRGLNKRQQPIIGGDLFLATPAGEVVQRLTWSPGRREEGPSWDPSGRRLAFTAYPVKQTFEATAGIGSSIVEINADGTCRRKVAFTYGLSYQDPVWQPGPGRDAGRIEC